MYIYMNTHINMKGIYDMYIIQQKRIQINMYVNKCLQKHIMHVNIHMYINVYTLFEINFIGHQESWIYLYSYM
jgi:hypothetical protein